MAYWMSLVLVKISCYVCRLEHVNLYLLDVALLESYRTRLLLSVSRVML